MCLYSSKGSSLQQRQSISSYYKASQYYNLKLQLRFSLLLPKVITNFSTQLVGRVQRLLAYSVKQCQSYNQAYTSLKASISNRIFQYKKSFTFLLDYSVFRHFIGLVFPLPFSLSFFTYRYQIVVVYLRHNQYFL